MENATPYSNLKIFAHADILNDIREEKRVAPIYIRIKPTNYCNHKCYYCSYADRELGLRNSVNSQDQIPWEKMQEIISDIADMGVKAVTLSGGGEPLVHRFLIPHIPSTRYLHHYRVVVSQRCHRIASFLRLALMQISSTLYTRIKKTLY